MAGDAADGLQGRSTDANVGLDTLCLFCFAKVCPRRAPEEGL